MKTRSLLLGLLAASVAPVTLALEKPGVTYSVFQFPANQIPRVDGDPSDWGIVPESYLVGKDQLRNDTKTPPAAGEKS
ncbi:MAG TPA: PKD domain containing protein, partial [Opitutus sp.]|nr:PKD domain containing protein [Opitutus sp.]